MWQTARVGEGSSTSPTPQASRITFVHSQARPKNCQQEMFPTLNHKLFPFHFSLIT